MHSFVTTKTPTSRAGCGVGSWDSSHLVPRRRLDATSHHSASLSLVAIADGELVGLCQASPAPHGATIDTVVHPDHQRAGIASWLLAELVRRLQGRNSAQLDAWTRDDPGTLAWYRTSGFDLTYRYLHVYASSEAEMNSAVTPYPGLIPRLGFFHADTQDAEVEADLRRRFSRVHACHRFLRQV